MHKIIIVITVQLLIINSLLGQKLKEGDTIVSFSFSDVSGKQYEYADFQHKKVILAFLNHPGCPSSNFRVQELKEEYKQLQSDNFEVIAIFNSTPETLKQYKFDTDIPFVLVADSDLQLFKKFGVENSLSKRVKSLFKKKKKLFPAKKYKKENFQTYMPADFILKENKVLEAYYGSYSGDYIPTFRINQF